ncbi:MBL fold metallo-hydrolase [Streptomyces gardneri]|uniref:MBL fold metallo-hydrolase n=1 Tax=Streptomyces gardneri TaxID=66892 RepID=UPI0036AB0527
MRPPPTTRRPARCAARPAPRSPPTGCHPSAWSCSPTTSTPTIWTGPAARSSAGRRGSSPLPAAAERLGGAAEGLAPWESREVTAGATTVRVTATPARHGPEGTEQVTGPVTGFVVEYGGNGEGGSKRTLYVSGDTVRHDALAEIGERFAIDTAFLHLGDAHFPATGDLAFSMSAREGAALARTLGARTVIPLHYDSWSHFTEDPARIAEAFGAPDLKGRLRRLRPGVAETL